MPDTRSDLHEKLTSWRKVAAEAKAGAARQKHPAAQQTEERFMQVAMLCVWIAGLASCLVLSWWLSGGNLFLTGIALLLPIGAWLLFGFYHWALLLPLSLMGLLALIGAFYLW